jgi:NADPH2:quinone reductase
MKAIQMMEAGSPDVLKLVDIDEPTIQTDTQLKVQLKAAGVNPLDTKLRSRGVFFDNALPAILGCDGAGVVVETGSAVSQFKPGDEVWFCNGGLGREHGNYAEYTVVEESVAEFKPKSLSFAEAAAAPLVLITAWEALYYRASVFAGHKVLIHGGAGGVGHVAIQLAKLAGAHVCTTVGSQEKAALVSTLGAEEVISYKDQDFVEAVNAWSHGHGADVVLDTVGGETFCRSIEATAHYGSLITLLEPSCDVAWKEVRNRNLRIGFVLMLTPMLRDMPAARAQHTEILEQCAQWIDDDELKINVNKILPLEQAAEAHRLLEAGHMQGKLVLSME